MCDNISTAGGKGQFKNQVNLTIQTLNVNDVIRKGKPDMALRPFDVVYVPESRIRRVDRFVDEYIRQLIPITATAGFTYLLGKNGIVRLP